MADAVVGRRGVEADVGALVPIQRVPSGLLTPGGTGSSPAAQGEFGGTQVGFLILAMTS